MGHLYRGVDRTGLWDIDVGSGNSGSDCELHMHGTIIDSMTHKSLTV